MRTQQKRRRAAGFTLVELMVVIAIIGLLATVVTVNVMGQMKDARIQKAKVDIKSIADAINLYKIKTGKYPQSLNDLFSNGQSLIQDVSSPEELKDPWGNKYGYTPPSGSTNYDVYSYGSDGGPGGVDEAADIHLKDARTQQ
jgi:general secretion pathway protein G